MLALSFASTAVALRRFASPPRRYCVCSYFLLSRAAVELCEEAEAEAAVAKGEKTKGQRTLQQLSWHKVA
jgi:hypothetical protein